MAVKVGAPPRLFEAVKVGEHHVQFGAVKERQRNGCEQPKERLKKAVIIDERYNLCSRSNRRKLLHH